MLAQLLGPIAKPKLRARTYPSCKIQFKKIVKKSLALVLQYEIFIKFACEKKKEIDSKIARKIPIMEKNNYETNTCPSQAKLQEFLPSAPSEEVDHEQSNYQKYPGDVRSVTDKRR